VAAWTSDGLLALFFFLIGVELKRELVAGNLRQPSRAVVPVAAALGGVVVPAVLYAAINAGGGDGLRGWPIPTATDIAFALAVLALVGRGLPAAARIFLLTLAVVDDLVAIVLIAVLYATDVDPLALVAAAVPLAAFAALVQLRPGVFERRPRRGLVVLLPLAVATWALVHASGIHATIAGVLLGFTVPVLYSERDRPAEHRHAPGGLAATMEHHLRPVSAGVAVPLFAFFAAGVPIGGREGITSALSDPVAIGILVGLVVGKPIGIVITTWIVTSWTRAELDADLRWLDLLSVGTVAGIGFTVSLLVAQLTFDDGTPHGDHAKIAILAASILATVLAAAVVWLGGRRRSVPA
jgi:NhaA family Na+:H+ antiporter